MLRMRPRMQVSLVPITDVDQIWSQLVPFIKRGLEATDDETCTLGEAWVKCRGGYAFILIAHEDNEIYMASIWETLGDDFHCLTLSGKNMKLWYRMTQKKVFEMSRMCGAKKLTAMGRDGWARRFGPKTNTGQYEVLLP